MENSDAGVGKFLWLTTVTVLLAGAILAGGCGVPNVSGWGLTWDNSVAIERERTKASINQENNITARHESDNWHATAQEWGGVAMVVGVVLGIGWAFVRVAPHIAAVFVAWSNRPHRPVAQPPQQIIVMAAPMLSAEPSATVEWVEEADYHGWALVNPRAQTLQPLQLTDSQRRS